MSLPAATVVHAYEDWDDDDLTQVHVFVRYAGAF